jgi:chromosomal replication initiation ATPase DnaA
LGDGDFIKRVLEDREPHSIVETPDIKIVIASVCATFGMSEEELKAPGKHWNRAEARAVATAVVRDLPGASISELSRYLARDASTLSHCADKLRERAVRDAKVEHRLRSVRLMVRWNSRIAGLTPPGLESPNRTELPASEIQTV